MPLTESQQAAVAARGNVLVVAGAGTGKTRTLVERCLHCLLAETPRASLDELLMVTFTEAAAAEMRQRIRARLQEEQDRQPADAHWAEQLALFETAHIGTLHSFCLELIRQHFYELQLDPQLTVMAEEEARLLADETLETLLQKHYAGRGPAAIAVQQLIQSQGEGRDEPIRRLVLRLHHYTQTLPDPSGWFDRQLAVFSDPEPVLWREWFRQGLADWRTRWLPELLALGSDNQLAGRCAALIERLNPEPATAGAGLAELVAAAAECPRGKKGLWFKPLKEFFAEAEFLLSLTESAAEPAAGPRAAAADPLVQDWTWVRPHLTTLLELAREFTRTFAEAKRELGVVDFHDLEQFALELLWDRQAQRPTPTAEQWQAKLRFIFVDEYQDINAAQDKILEALSRPGHRANRFLVGDVKQSIYRFRLANPYIFQGYIEQWGQAAPNGESEGKLVALADNFRSREGLLDFVNSLFAVLMRPELGAVAYDERARLRFGAAVERQQLARRPGDPAAVELHLRLKQRNGAPGDDEDASEALTAIGELEESAKEARLVALRLRELRRQQRPVWDESAGEFRPVDWRDMAVLLRAPSGKAESYAKEFARLQVPLELARGGFYESAEILDLLSLLQVLDNPLQDLPLIAVLRSPSAGLTLDELAAVRLALSKAPFWTALMRWQQSAPPPHDTTTACRRRREESSGTEGPQPQTPRVVSYSQCEIPGLAKDSATTTPKLSGKVAAFLERYARWRRLAREVPLSRCLESILTETHYPDWLLTQPRGEQRRANVQRLLGLAQDFDQFQRQGLFRFLRFIAAQQSAGTEPEVATVAEQNAVRLLSIHQSKGLEFPVVVVADAGKPFNVADLRADTILDEVYGLCPQVRSPHTPASYPSLPYWLARRRQHRELLAEELRLLYVALTRARDVLLITGTLTAGRFEKIWQNPGRSNAAALLGARCYADWLGWWFSQNLATEAADAKEGAADGVSWAVHEDMDLMDNELPPQNGGDEPTPEAMVAPSVWQALERRLSWRYDFTPATRLPAKTSVTSLRRQAAAEDEEAVALLAPPPLHPPNRRQRRTGTAAEIGTAHHRFLQWVALEQTSDRGSLRREAERLRDLGLLGENEFGLLDFNELDGFWASELGSKIRAQARWVQRELEFTARFGAEELARVTGRADCARLEEEFVVVQGIADLVVIEPKKMWLLDFKTDAVAKAEVNERARLYEPQLHLYARALEQIYQRPVTESWLYFLAAQQAVKVKSPDNLREPSAA